MIDAGEHKRNSTEIKLCKVFCIKIPKRIISSIPRPTLLIVFTYSIPKNQDSIFFGMQVYHKLFNVNNANK